MSKKSRMMSDEWGTPQSIYRMLTVLSPVDQKWFDPCPSLNQKNDLDVGFGQTIFFDTHGRGLNRQWSALNFVNPPFSDIQPWLEKAKAELDEFNNRTVMVVPAHLDRRWFLDLVQPWTRYGYVDMVSIGRQKYVPLAGQKESSPRFGSCLLTFGTGFRTDLLIDYLSES